MEAAESATQLTLALVEKMTPIGMGSNSTDPQATAKWVRDAYNTILIGVVEAIKEANKH